MKTHYDTLGVAQDAAQREIRRAYLRQIRKYHPDRNPHKDAHRITALLNEAYTVLSDADAREAYDRGLSTPVLYSQEPKTTRPVPAKPQPWMLRMPRMTTVAGVVVLGAVAYFAVVLLADFWQGFGESSLSQPQGAQAIGGVKPSGKPDETRKPAQPAVRLATGASLQSPLDTNGRGELRVENDTKNDAVVYVVEADSHRIARSFFVRAGEEYSEKGIGNGRYQLSFTSGMDWNAAAERFNRDVRMRSSERVLTYAERDVSGAPVRYEVRLSPSGSEMDEATHVD